MLSGRTIAFSYRFAVPGIKLVNDIIDDLMDCVVSELFLFTRRNTGKEGKMSENMEADQGTPGGLEEV